jgi:hypothetical protein
VADYDITEIQRADILLIPGSVISFVRDAKKQLVKDWILKKLYPITICSAFSAFSTMTHLSGGVDQNDAVYVHRIVVNPHFKGQRQFQNILNWVKLFAINKNLKFVRMDTWVDNFKLIENYKATNTKELPIQNRNLNVALLEMELKGEEIINN